MDSISHQNTTTLFLNQSTDTLAYHYEVLTAEFKGTQYAGYPPAQFRAGLVMIRKPTTMLDATLLTQRRKGNTANAKLLQSIDKANPQWLFFINLSYQFKNIFCVPAPSELATFQWYGEEFLVVVSMTTAQTNKQDHNTRILKT